MEIIKRENIDEPNAALSLDGNFYKLPIPLPYINFIFADDCSIFCK